MTLKLRFIISIITLQLLSYLVLGYFNNSFLEQEQERALTREVKQTLRNASDRINDSYLTIKNKALDIGIAIKIYMSALDKGAKSKGLTEFAKQQLSNAFLDIEEVARVEIQFLQDSSFSIDPQNSFSHSLVSGSSDPSDHFLNSPKWPILVPIGNQNEWLSAPYHNVDGLMVISFVRKIYYDNLFVGLIRIDWSMGAVANYLKTIDLSRNSFNFLLDKDSQLLLTYLDDEINLAQPLYNNVYIRDQVDVNISDRVDVIEAVQINDYLYDIFYVDTKVGLVFGAVIPKDNISDAVQNILERNVMIASVIVVIFTLINAFLINGLFKPLNRIVTKIKSSIRKDAEGQLHVSTIQYLGKNEFTVVVNALNAVFDQVNDSFLKLRNAKAEIESLNKSLDIKVLERTRELDAKSKDLESSIEKLKLAQNELIAAEKMASLGSLVAGVSHEINTPIGIAVTAITHLKSSVMDVSQKFEDRTLSEADFKEFRGVALEGSQIIEKNLDRAADLIKNFKMVAVDQSSDEKRQINFLQYTNNVISSLKPEIKKANLSVDVCIDPNITVYISPGAYSQVLTIMVQNTIIHGLDGRKSGCVKLSVELTGSELIIFYSDNGVGMDQEHLKKLFDPFFTTRRGAGGSGLGAHILFNIVTQSFGGVIAADSSVNQGLSYLIKIPKTYLEVF